jgi:hypothetical protein
MITKEKPGVHQMMMKANFISSLFVALALLISSSPLKAASSQHSTFHCSTTMSSWPLAAASLPWGRIAQTGARRCLRILKSPAKKAAVATTRQLPSTSSASAPMRNIPRGRFSGASRPSRRVAAPNSPIPTIVQQEGDDITYSELGVIGKLIAGMFEIVLVTLIEYATAFLGGYVLGTVTDVPRLLFQKSNLPQSLARPQLLTEVSHRMLRLHGKSMNWATSWGSISAAFGGFRVTFKVLRGNVEDDWNTILSSIAAGAYFARAGK